MKNEVQELIQSFSSAVNRMGMSEEKEMAQEIADQFVKEHRTLQQGMIRILAQAIAITDKKVKEGQAWDARNEASMRWINKVAKIEAIFPFI